MQHASPPVRARRSSVLAALLLAVGLLRVGWADAEVASTMFPAAGARLDTGGHHTCAIVGDGAIRCWGFNLSGQLGYGHKNPIGFSEPPAAAGPVDLGADHTGLVVSAGMNHTCALLETRNVLCWGQAGFGQLGYGNTTWIGDTETPGSIGTTVNIGGGGSGTAQVVAAGANHTCALRDDWAVLCWGLGLNGRLGYGNTANIGDNETPATAGTVDLGSGRTARAIAAGFAHTCAILDTGSVLCWGLAAAGQLGYGTGIPPPAIGDNETPGSLGYTVDLGAGRTALTISAGSNHSCAVLDTHDVLCWGRNDYGQLGYGNGNTTIGDDETPGSLGYTVDLGPGRTALAVSAGGYHTCALLDTRDVLCWGRAASGAIGYGDTANNVGDNETPGGLGHGVDIAAGRIGLAVSAATTANEFAHSCVMRDDATVLCWGDNGEGQLGQPGADAIGDNEPPGTFPAVDVGGQVNSPPAVDAGTDMDIEVPEGGTATVQLSGAAIDPDGLALTAFAWTGTPDPPDVPAPPPMVLPIGSYEFTLTAMDVVGRSTSDTVEVHIHLPGSPPPTTVPGGSGWTCITPAETPFTDVAGSFAAVDIACLYERGIVSGTAPGQYSPTAPVTREQMAVLLIRAYEFDTGGPYAGPAPNPFTDIAGSYAEDEIAQLVGLGVTAGVAADLYGPLLVLTREQMAVFLVTMWEELAGEPAPVGSSPFNDIGGSFAAAEIQSLVALGITAGTGPGTFSPAAPVTREQMAVFLARLLQSVD